MGKDKALLTLPNGQPLLARTADVAQQLTDDVVVVTPWPDRYQSILPANIQLVQETQRHQPAAEEPPCLPRSDLSHPGPKLSAGPLSGFAQGWQHIASDWCLLLACDLPYLQSGPLKQWWAWIASQVGGKGDATPTSASLIAATHRGPQCLPAWEPLCGFYHRDCLPGLVDRVDAIAATDEAASSAASIPRSFQSWLQTLSIAAYPHFPPELLFNCNTPQDWAQVAASSASESVTSFK